MRRWLCLALLASAALADDAPRADARRSKSVTTVLSAKWEATPLVLELAEYMAGESADLFWSFVDGVNALKPPIEELDTDKRRYDAAISVANSLLAPAQLRLARLALSMHSASPAVRMLAEVALQGGPAACETYVAVAGSRLCDDAALRDVLRSVSKLNAEEHRLETYSLDHRHPRSTNRSLTAILYGELGTRDFAAKHNILAGAAEAGTVDYIVRWNVKPRGGGKLRLSGYGVELQLKSTEYKSQDDSTPAADEGEAEAREGAAAAEREADEDENDPQNMVDGFNFGRLKNLFPALRTPLERFRRHLAAAGEELAPLKVWQMQALSMQAAAAVVDAADAGGDEPLRVLASVAQNFPMQTKSLIHVSVPRALREEVLHNQEVWASTLGVRPAEPLLLVAGAQHDADEPDVLALLAALRDDIAPINTLHALALPNKLINKLVSLELGEASPQEEYALDLRHAPVTWLNDLETDERYRRWPTSYMELLRPAYPGMLRNLRRNMYNYVIVFDPTSRSSSPPLQLAETLLRHATPVRVGVVLSDAAERAPLAAAARAAFNYVAQEKNSNREAFFFLSQLLESSPTEYVTVEQIKKQLKKYAGSDADLDAIVSEDSEYNFGGQLAQEFVDRIGTNKFPEVLINGVPLAEEGEPVLSSATLLEEALVAALARHTGRLQRAVFRGQLSDSDDVVDYLMNQPHVMPRLNRRVLTLEPSQFVDMSGVAASPELFTEEKIHKLLGLSGRDALATALGVMRYFERPGKAPRAAATVWVVGDLGRRESRDLLRSALQFMTESRGVRVAFVPNAEGSESGGGAALNRVALAALAALEPPAAAAYVSRLLADEGCHEREDCHIMPELVPALNRHEWILKASRVLCVRALRAPAPGDRALLYNGRLLGPLRADESFTLEDFNLLERFTNQAYGDKISELLFTKKTHTNDVTDDDEDDEAPPELSADALVKVTSALASRPARARVPLPDNLRADHSVVELPPAYPSEAAVEVVAVLDPASAAAQRLAPLLLVLRRVVNCRVRLFMNPLDKNSDMPLTSFYRYVLEPELQFTAEGALAGGAGARFSRLPQAPLLSLELRVPPNWLVECVKSVYDLDNIRLADVDSVVHSEFELEYLLLEGHAWDAALGTPPRGLQLTLGTRAAPDARDTIVMANLGYFQLKAAPGAWILRLRPGRSAELYDIVGHENTDTPSGSADIQVLMSSFRSHVVKLRVSKKPGKQGLDLLSDNDENATGGIWNSIASSFGGGEEEAGEETINVFSVASGHLYERFLRIMMLSVLKHTKSPVKFWFLKNYLSPSLKDILPYMSAEYGFEYELVQYEWPRWLQRQRDRQRTIWGYKILFLDVLFPLHVKKIIFVDADQIVRADLKELVDLDLGGAPYGYTPFCDSRTEMEGFRFWKQGYWRNHLQGRRYHISALYVVDLKRFRRIAAGDRLRGQYQALSQDPNSLSNLDQDLPNNMIHQVAIKSLPQEWLWCETWCDNASKGKAKTIDLCNNPQTKEAKLSAAMRIVPEWRDYDEEVKGLAARVRRGLFQAADSEQEQEVAAHSVGADSVASHEEHGAHSEL